MEKIICGKNGNDLYLYLLNKLKEEGDIVSPRGMKTRELSPVITVIEKPRQRLLSVKGRVINPFFLVAEILWILSGRGDREFIKYFCNNLDNYAEPEYPDFNGAYGVRLRKWGQDRERQKFGNPDFPENKEEYICFDQIKDVCEKLKKDKDTRQAVMTLHNPYFDRADIVSNDRPCNITSMFKIRNGKLNLHQVIRSNDINMGLFPTNLFQWSIIQEVIASDVGVDVGELLFFSDSLHVYEDDPITNRVKIDSDFDVYDYVETFKIGSCLKETDHYIQQIIKDIEEYKKDAIIPMSFGNMIWNTFRTMCLIYIERKKGHIEKAIEMTKYIELKDYRILAFNYHWNKAKTEEERNLIKKYIRLYAKPVRDFIMEV